MKKIADKYLPKETVREQLPVLMHELGDLAKCIVYMDLYPKDKKLYLLFAKDAIADLLAQMQLLCERLDLDLQQLLEYGILRFEGRMEVPK